MASTLNASTSGGGGIIATADASGVMGLQTAGTTAVTIDASQNVGIGTNSPSQKLDVNGNIQGTSLFSTGGGSASVPSIRLVDVGTGIWHPTTDTIGFSTAGTERMRIDSSGNVLVNNSVSTRGKFSILGTESTSNASISTMPTVDGYVVLSCRNAAGTQSGYIYTNASTTAYNTSSDYRLKENIQPMVGALDTVAQLKPVTYNWIADGSKGQGFIAHELQAVVPDCVTGEKDAVDADGNPIYQGIDTSFLVATLTAAIQELKAELDTVKAELAELKGASA